MTQLPPEKTLFSIRYIFSEFCQAVDRKDGDTARRMVSTMQSIQRKYKQNEVHWRRADIALANMAEVLL